MAGELLGPDLYAGVAEQALARALAALRSAEAARDAATAAQAAAEAALSKVAALSKAIGVTTIWSGPNRSILSVLGPDGTYGPGSDLEGPEGPTGATPTLRGGTIALGDLAFDIDVTDPKNPVLSLTLPPGPRGIQGPVGVSGANFVARSASALSVGTGPKAAVLTADSAVGFATCQYLALVSASDGGLSMAGRLAGYDPDTRTLSLTVDQATGLGTASDWIVTPTPPPGLFYGIDAGYGDDPTPQTASPGRVSYVLAGPTDLAALAAYIISPAFKALLPTSPPVGGGLYLDNGIVTEA